MPTATLIKPVTMPDLLQQSQEREAQIARIKAEVAIEPDNLNAPKPLFEQLTTR